MLVSAITEGTFLRLQMQLAADISFVAAWQSLTGFQRNPRHSFIDDGFSYAHFSNHRL